jgi:hypothetical protein
MGFWSFFWKTKSSKHTQKEKPGPVQGKMAQAVEGSAEKTPDPHGEESSRFDSKRRRTEKATTISESSPVLKESAATPKSAQPTMNSSRNAASNSTNQGEKSNIRTGERHIYQHKQKSNSSVGQDHFSTTSTPTLRAKRRDNDSSLSRRKSSKRMAEDQAREREVRAMSSPIPIPKRPLSYTEGPLRRDARKAPARLRKHAARHTSEVSLPVPESLSDLGIASNQSSFKVNALDILSPRPTVRYTRSPRSAPAKSENRAQPFARNTIVEEDYSSKKRIDDLADSLDAGALRELMERDQRRRERKRTLDQAKLQQKLERRAGYQREQVSGRKRRPRTEQEEDSAGPAFSSPAEASIRDDGKNIAADPFSDDNVVGPELPVPSRLRPGSSIYTRTSQASFSPPTSPSQRAFDRASLSQTSGLPREATPDIADIAELSCGASGQSNTQLGSWTAFFRRGGTRGKTNSIERGRHGSGEFSNTSRDSISRAQPQASIVGAPRTFRRSGTPQRTQSKFREDLPELPLSPPDSRVQSPEAGVRPVTLPAPPDQGEAIADSSRLPTNVSSRATFDQTSKDDLVSLSQIDGRQTPPPAAALSQSLASVDSEASWLSGKAVKRSSVQRDQALRHSQSSLQPRLPISDMGDEADVADDPYFSRLSPGPEERRKSSSISALRKASSTALNIGHDSEAKGELQLPQLPDTNDTEKWHSGLGRQPTLIRQAVQARSKEGLLNEYQATDAESGMVDDEASDLESPDLEDGDLPASSSPIFRAQSVNYGQGHVRHISAGSAKLLDIRPSSIETKRQSLPRGERSSTPIRSPEPTKEE